jgi:hypothetical protein
MHGRGERRRWRGTHFDSSLLFGLRIPARAIALPFHSLIASLQQFIAKFLDFTSKCDFLEVFDVLHRKKLNTLQGWDNILPFHCICAPLRMVLTQFMNFSGSDQNLKIFMLTFVNFYKFVINIKKKGFRRGVNHSI